MSGISDWYVRHDGMPAMECYCKWDENREAVERGGMPLRELTKAQIAAGRSLHNSLRGNPELVSTLLKRDEDEFRGRIPGDLRNGRLPDDLRMR